MTDAFGGALRGRRVLVTGHTGFKGSWLCVWLRELGAKVTGFGLAPPTTPSNYQVSNLSEHVVDVRGDVRDADHLKRTIESHEPQIVIHMAAQPLVRVGYEKPKETFDTNVVGTVNLLEAVRTTRSVRVCVVVTTDKVYEDRGWVWGYRENDTLGGFDPYSASKAMAELAVQSYRRSWSQSGFADHPVSIATVRAGNVIGGGDWAAHRLVPDCLRDLMAGRPIQVNTPDSVRPWMFLLEPLSGYLCLVARLLDEPDQAGCWNFGPSEQEAITCRQLAEEASAIWGGQGIVVPDRAGGGPPHQTRLLRLNWDKAANELRWRPVYTWGQAIRCTIDWFAEHGRPGSSGGPADMYGVCARQIADYVSAAAACGIEWARGTNSRSES